MCTAVWNTGSHTRNIRYTVNCNTSFYLFPFSCKASSLFTQTHNCKSSNFSFHSIELNNNNILIGCVLLLLFMCRKWGSVELNRSCVKGSETGFKLLRQPSRFVTFSTVQKFLWAMVIIKYIIFITSACGRGGGTTTLLTDTDHLYLILTHCGRVTQVCVFNTVKLSTSASSPYCHSTRGNVSRGITPSSTTRVSGEYFIKISVHKNS